MGAGSAGGGEGGETTPPATSDSVTIGGQSVMMDYDYTLQPILDYYLSTEYFDSLLRPRTSVGQPVENLESSVFANPYPDLPPLRVGQMQIPTGFSRYSRAAFLVDQYAMARIALMAFQDVSQTDAESKTLAQLTTSFPQLFGGAADPTATIRWGTERTAIKLSLDYENTIEFDMYVLSPIRIPYAAGDLWLLILVDERYEWQSIFESKTDKEIKDRTDGVTWQELIDWGFTKLSIPTTGPSALQKTVTVASDLGEPDMCCFNSRSSVAATMDAVVLSIGYRFVPEFGLMAVDAATSARANQLSSTLIAYGGLSGQCDLPGKINFYGRKVVDWYGGTWSRLGPGGSFDDMYKYTKSVTAQTPDTTEPHGHDLAVMCLWNVNITGTGYDTLFSNFATAWTNKWLPWHRQDMDVVYSGIPQLLGDYDEAPTNLKLLTGFDDLAIITVDANVQAATTRIISLPHKWIPKWLVNQNTQDLTQYGSCFFIAVTEITAAFSVAGTPKTWKLGKGTASLALVKEATGGPFVVDTEQCVEVLSSLNRSISAGTLCQGDNIGGRWIVRGDC